MANKFDELKNAGTKKIPALQGTLVTSLFFEASTRTLNRELAATSTASAKGFYTG